MSPSASSFRTILDIPDEILVDIILHFDARERLALGNSCRRFHDLVFGDGELLRNLDFTRESQLAKASDIQQYFNNENALERILRLNIENVRVEESLIVSIRKAINLVDLNILNATKFRMSEEELRSFLEPLVHLKRLSVNWPMLKDTDNAIGSNLWKEPLSRLTYLSIELYRYSREFLLALQFCQRLEELRIVTGMPSRERDISSYKAPMKLGNLRVLKFRGVGSSGPLKRDLISMVQDPAEWTDFHLIDPHTAGYLERDVKVCEELGHIMALLVRPASIPPFNLDLVISGLGGNLFCERLLTRVIRLTHQDAPEEFCCLSWSAYSSRQPCLLKIDEAKELLKDPEYWISYLHFSHVIDRNCDAHLLASAFPGLSELVVSRIGNRNLPEGNGPSFIKRLTKRGSIASEEFNDPINPDSSFKMLIENSPHLRGLTISPTDAYNTRNESLHWDLDALRLIPRWTNLTAIRLKDVPIADGNLLVDVGRECKNLEEVMLCRLGVASICCYADELLEMLKFCKNLKTFSVCQTKVENTSAVFDGLSNNTELRRVRLMTNTDTFDSVDLASSVQRMLRNCQKLTKLTIRIDSFDSRVVDELKPALKRIVGELNRPNFQLDGPDRSASSAEHRNSSNSFFPSPLDDQEFGDYWL